MNQQLIDHISCSGPAQIERREHLNMTTKVSKGSVVTLNAIAVKVGSLIALQFNSMWPTAVVHKGVLQ